MRHAFDIAAKGLRAYPRVSQAARLDTRCCARNGLLSVIGKNRAKGRYSAG
jgi:hypothetical protein